MRARWSWSLLALLTLSAACSDEGDPVQPQDPGPDPVSFVDRIQPIFDAHCTGCHGAGGNGGLDLRSPQSHGNLVGVQATGYAALRVAASDPGASVLYDKVLGGGMYGDRMPFGGPYLSSAQIESIRRWIAEGATSE